MRAIGFCSTSLTAPACRVWSASLVAATCMLVASALLPRPVEAQATVVPARWTSASQAAEARATFALRVGGFVVPLRVMAMTVLPGGEVTIVREGSAGGRLSAVAGGGRLRERAQGSWSWTAPDEPGFVAVRFVSQAPADTINLTFMVARPATAVRGGALNGYRIGEYRARPASMSERYEPPRGFVEARPTDYDIMVSPNFRLGDFLCKDPGDPRYLLVSPRLLIKLEALLVAVNEAGYPARTLTVMSGFRTPAYNRAIGNTTDFSRHLWGDAADVFVDIDGNGDMDDLTGDGVSNLADARWLAGLMEGLMAEEGTSLPPGGMSVYRRNSAHGPFVHIDARGRRARW